jgi:hypothetical protein
LVVPAIKLTKNRSRSRRPTRGRPTLVPTRPPNDMNAGVYVVLTYWMEPQIINPQIRRLPGKIASSWIFTP